MEVLQPICDTTHTVKDSFTFAKKIKSKNIPYMVSFDVCSLFTNVPLNETIQMCLNKLFKDTETVHNLNRQHMAELLSFAVKENHFVFNDTMYDQLDGVAMWSPLGPVLANIFMANLESMALRPFSGNKPVMYCRYVDDIFLAFQSKDDVNSFFQWMNDQHPQIKFTLKEETNKQISFLDVLVHRQPNGEINFCV